MRLVDGKWIDDSGSKRRASVTRWSPSRGAGNKGQAACTQVPSTAGQTEAGRGLRWDDDPTAFAHATATATATAIYNIHLHHKL